MTAVLRLARHDLRRAWVRRASSSARSACRSSPSTRASVIRPSSLKTSPSACIERWLPNYIADNRSYLTVGIGCTGGQHRSVYLAEKLARHFEPQQQVLVRHRELA